MDQRLLDPSTTGPSLEQLLVADAMHPGVVTCPLETPLRDVAWTMGTHRIHAVVVYGEIKDDGPALWGVVSDLDLVRAVGSEELENLTAASIAETPVLLVSPDDRLAHAAELMAVHRVAHLIVVEPESGRPLGVVSTLDIARALGR